MGREETRSLLTGLKASFSSDGDCFAVLLPGGNIKIWNTSNGSLVADWKDHDGDSGAEYSCISCGFIGKKHKKEYRPFLLALGTHSGDILAVDVASGEKKWTNSKCHSSGIATLLFGNEGHALYAGGNDGVLSELNSETGESMWRFKASNRPIASLALSFDKKLLAVGGGKIRIFKLDDKEELLKFSSDLGPSQNLAVSDNAMTVVSSMFGQKQLEVWSCDYENRKFTAEAVLSLNNLPVVVDCKCYDKDGIIVLSVSETGVTYVWHLMSISQNEIAPIRIMVKSVEGNTALQRSAKKNRIPILNAKFCQTRKNAQVKVLVAYGSPDNLQFKSVEVNNDGKDIFLTMQDDKPVHEITTTNLQENMDPEVKEDDGGLENPFIGTVAIRQKRKKQTTSTVNSSYDLEGIHINSELGGESDMNEPTIAEKLASLGFLDDEKTKSTSNQEPSTSPNPPRADSVHLLLKQALHADDRALLLDCLYTRDEKVIAKSTSLLNPEDVLKFLRSLISLIESRGAVLVCMLPWLRSLLSQHASSIVSQESSLLILNSLYQLIESRISTFGSALQLSTCLDYLFVGIPDDEADEDSMGPPIIYEDKDSDEEEEEEDTMESEEDNEELGTVIDSLDNSDGSEVMSE